MDAYIGEVRIFAGNFTPADWLDCNGQVLQVRQYQGLYAAIGNLYGGTGPSTFAVPDLRGCVPVHQGAGPGLTPRTLNSGGGAAAVTLDMTQIPNHTHVPQALDTQGPSKEPNGALWAKPPKAGRPVAVDQPNFSPTLDTPMSPLALGAVGGNQSHNNMQPYLPVRFIICAQGTFPVPA